MPVRPRNGDRGQTLPLYVMAVAGLLFLGFAFFTFAQAATVRNGAQSAADAAALAAAQESREDLLKGFLDAVENDEDWGEWLDGKDWRSSSACDEAGAFAGRNDSDVVACGEADGGRRGYTVQVRTRYAVGRSVVPGVEGKTATADATAVVEPRCEFDEDAVGEEPIEFTCDGRDWSIDPDDDDPPEGFDLFAVYLED